MTVEDQHVCVGVVCSFVETETSHSSSLSFHNYCHGGTFLSYHWKFTK